MGFNWERIRFLYRTDAGAIDRETWRRGAAALVAALVPFTLIWLALEPYTDHDLAKSPLWVPMTAAAYAFLILYAFIVMLIAISFVNLSAKRFRALGRPWPLGLASLLPLFALLAGASHFLQPRVAEVMPRWYIYPVDAALAGLALWTVYELGFVRARRTVD
jgi:hypothetical protein